MNGKIFRFVHGSRTCTQILASTKANSDERKKPASQCHVRTVPFEDDLEFSGGRA